MNNQTQEESRLPKELLEVAIKSGSEFGWRQSHFLTVVEKARDLKIAIIGGQVQYVLPDGTCELYWLSYDTTQREIGEPWSDYCERTVKETIAKFNELLAKTDIEQEALRSFDFLRNKKANGFDIQDYLTFILYFDQKETCGKK